MEKPFYLPGFVLLAIVLMMTRSLGTAQEQQPGNLVIELVDGSRISGKTTARALPFKTAYAGMDLEIALIQRIDFANGEKNARVLLNNGDILQGTFDFNAINIETLLGMQSVPLSLITTMTIRSSIIQRGLVLHYSFDDLEGTLVADKSGHRNSGVTHGTAVRTSAETLFREFNGKNNYIECSNSSSLNMQSGMSILAWMNPNSWGNGQSNCVVSKKESDYNNGYVLYNDGYYPRELTLRIRGASGSANMLHSRSAVDIRTLQHWTVTYDADAKEVRLYKNGVVDTVYNSVYVGDMSNDLPLHIGHAQTWNGYFGGSLGNVMVYDRALSPEEVRQIYNSQKYKMH
jgi:hypothetical protein